MNSIVKGRISHAYCFSGPRGVGKTTMARILAKALNCEKGPTPHPCGVCDNCREIRTSSSFDVIEIDGASNNSVEDIRELRENVNFAPVKSKYKIYIIDEVHMLSTAAFNALLKTLEEPPPHIVFIFATTEVHKIPDTILSRCQKFFFKRIPVEPIVRQLRVIADREGFRISDRALYPVARAAEGSMRDAQSLLDQVISFSDRSAEGGDEIGEEDALAILGIVPLESHVRLLESIARCDTPSALEEFNRVVTLGVDIPRYLAGLMDLLRTVRLLRNGVALGDLLGLSQEEIALVREVSRGISDEEISMMFRILSDVKSDLRYSGNEITSVEMGLLDMIAVRQSPSIASIISRLEGSDADGMKPNAAAHAASSTADVKPKPRTREETSLSGPSRQVSNKPAGGSSQAAPEEERAPLPEVETLKRPVAEEFDSANPAVEKIKNAFHGEILDKKKP